MKYKFTILILLTFGLAAFAQQDPNYTFYRYNMNFINPAYAGADVTELGLNVRSQWASIEGAPETQSAFFGTPVGRNVGLGLSIINDRTFIENQTWLALDFSYRLILNSNTDVFFGIKAGLNSYKANTDGLISYEIQADPSLTNLSSSFNPNIGAGVYVRHKDYYISISIPKILTSDRLENNNGEAILNRERIHFYISSGYDFALSDKLGFKPSAMFRMVENSPISLELTGALEIHKRFEIGTAYRFDESVGGFFIFKATKGIHLGYAYEAVLENTITYSNNGSHEIIMKLHL